MAPSDMRPRPPQVPQDFLVVTARVNHSVRQNTEPSLVQVTGGQVSLLVDPLGQPANQPVTSLSDDSRDEGGQS